MLINEFEAVQTQNAAGTGTAAAQATASFLEEYSMSSRTNHSRNTKMRSWLSYC